MKYRLCDWEDNGYHDSYFYGAYYDTGTGTIESLMIGATAFAGGTRFSPPDYLDPTPEILEAARCLLADYIYQQIREAEHADVLTPQDADPGDTLRFIQAHRQQLKVTEPCHKCEGTGHWINPRRPTDRRTCFSCHGAKVVGTSEFLKGPDGKRQTRTIPAGTIGTVIQVKAYGSFYRNGYNRPDRTNRTVTMRLADGTIAKIPLKKLRLDKEPMSDAELRTRAEDLSHHHNYGAMCGCRAWLATNWASALADRLKKEAA